MSDIKVAVVIVLYESVLESYPDLGGDVFQLIMVDNTPNRQLTVPDTGIVYIPLLKNCGIARAQNVGIDKARELKCDYIVFFDQDSILSKSYVENLLHEYVKHRQQNPRIAIMGPIIRNKNSDEEYKSLLANSERFRDGLCFCDNVISSGSIVSVGILDEIGGLDDSLFIDYVDFEWCWRAIAKGYLCCRNSNIKLHHMIGNDRAILGRKTSIPTPFRCYYQYRNYFLLCRREYVPLRWRMRAFIVLSYRFIVFPMLLKNRKSYLKNIIKGIKDGVKW